MSATLLEINENSAVVAEKVVTYKRKEVIAAIPELQEKIKETDKLLAEDSENIEFQRLHAEHKYNLELYMAIKDAFEKEFPTRN